MHLNENKKINIIIGITFSIVLVAVYSIHMYMSEFLYTHESFTMPAYVLFVIMSVLLLVFILISMKNEKYTIEYSVFLAIICMGFLANFIFTPFSVPDEYVHYYSAYHVSNQLLFQFDDLPSLLTMRGEDILFTQNIHLLSKSQYMKLVNEFYVLCKNAEISRFECAYIGNKFFLYFPAAIGIAIGRLFNLSAYMTFSLGRITNLLFFASGVYIALRLMPFGKRAVATIALLPMSIHIAASYSYDVFSTVGVILIFSYIMHMMYSEDKISYKQIVILAAMIAFVIPHKVVYIGVAAIVLLVPKKQFVNPKLHFLIKCGWGLVGIISIFVLQFANTARLIGEVDTSAPVGYTFPYILANFSEFTRLMLKTTIHFADYYTKGLVAYFGWFQIEAPWVLTIFVLGFVFLSFMKMRGEPDSISGIGRIYALLLFVAVYAVTLVLLLIDHTPMGSVIILGVQGRYFIAALPLIYVALRNDTIVLEPNADKMIIFGVCCADVLIFIFTLARALTL